MKKEYERPKAKIVNFHVDDIITISSSFIDGGSTYFQGSWIETDVDGKTVNFKEDWQW